MEIDNIEQKVIQITGSALRMDETKISSISSASRFVEDLGADSLDLVEVMLGIESAFKCEIPDEEASKIVTIEDAVKYVKEKIAAKG